MTYCGLHPHTGHTLADLDHLKQSIVCVLTTPIGSRVMRRDFGSLLPALIDQPINRATVAKLNAAAVMALLRWEPRIQLSRVLIALGEQAGEVVVSIACTRRDDVFRQQTFDWSLRLPMGARS